MKLVINPIMPLQVQKNLRCLLWWWHGVPARWALVHNKWLNIFIHTMYNAAFLTKCFDSIYYLQQGATRWRLKKHTEGSMMPCRFRRRRWKMWRKRRCKGTWMVWKRQAFLETFFYSPLDLNFSNIVFSCIRRNWIHWWGPWWTAVGGGESCSSTVTSTGPMQTLGSTSVTCMTSYLFIFSRCFRGKGSNGKDTRFWNTFPHICFIRWNKKYIDSDINVCLLIMVHVD